MKSLPMNFLLGLLLMLAGCASPLPPETVAAWLPTGYYKFDCPIVYENGLARLEPVRGGMNVTLLEKIKGTFVLQAKADGRLAITQSEMDYPGLRRSFKGEGQVIGGGKAEGTAVVWVKNFGIVGRDHRKGAWTLRPASESEINKFEARARSLEERKRRAGFAE